MDDPLRLAATASYPGYEARQTDRALATVSRSLCLALAREQCKITVWASKELLTFRYLQKEYSSLQ